MASTQYVRAIYDFTPSEPGDIDLSVGDVLLITGRLDHNWLTGKNLLTSEAKTGNFPADFVEPCEVPTVGEDEHVFIAKVTLNSNVEGDLSFRKGRFHFVGRQ
jgi:SH3 domain